MIYKYYYCTKHVSLILVCKMEIDINLLTPPLCQGSRSPLEKTILLADLISTRKHSNLIIIGLGEVT